MYINDKCIKVKPLIVQEKRDLNPESTEFFILVRTSHRIS